MVLLSLMNFMILIVVKIFYNKNHFYSSIYLDIFFRCGMTKVSVFIEKAFLLTITNLHFQSHNLHCILETCP
jgi:hypothetical protein